MDQRNGRKERKERTEEKNGLEQGKKVGIKQNQQEVAKKLIKMKLSINQIIDVTGLTKEEVEKLKKVL